MKANKQSINFQEYGAGSSISNGQKRKIATIAQNALSGPYQCRVMHRLVNYTKAETVVELGTSLGISALYLGSPAHHPQVYTLEGDENSFNIASGLFEKLSCDNIHPILGKFSDTLIPTLNKVKQVDIAFIDGHHSKDATLDYFSMIQPYCKQSSIIIVDDIYWSQGMNEAWNIIKDLPGVTYSIDLFFCGFIFFDKKFTEKEHIKIKPGKLLFHI
nr:class I SAM-dependent methyltransferase [Portibacter lacus]